MSEQPARQVQDMVFAGFNRRVIALDRYTGEILWDWKAHQGSGFVSLLLDGDRLIVGVNGYVYCLDPLFGQDVWQNPMKGKGLGIMSLASIAGQSTSSEAAAVAAAQAAAAASASASASAAT